MAICFLDIKEISQTQKQSVIVKAAYIAGDKLHHRKTNTTVDYTHKKGVLFNEIITPIDAPAWAKDRQKLWNQAEAVEEYDETPPAIEAIVELLKEFDFEQNKALIHGFIQEQFIARGIIADLSIHESQGIVPSLHAHILLTTRDITTKDFGQINPTELDEDELREKWANHINAYLEQAGFDERVDHHKLEIH